MTLFDQEPWVSRARRIFERGERTLAATVLALASAGNTRARQMSAARKRVSAVVSGLVGDVRAWVREALAALVRSEGGEATRVPSIVRSMAEDLAQDLAGATDQMDRDAKRALREIARRNLFPDEDSAADDGEALRREMEARGIAFVDRGGRRWSPGAYAAMVARTHLVSIRNALALLGALREGVAAVRVRDALGGDTDEPCHRANGQVWSISYALRNLLEHPNCTRQFIPLFEGGTSVRLDRA